LPPGTEAISGFVPVSAPLDKRERSTVLEQLGQWLAKMRGEIALLGQAQEYILELEQRCRELSAGLGTAQTAERDALRSAAEAISGQELAQSRVRALEEQPEGSQEGRQTAIARVRSLESQLDAVRGQQSELRNNFSQTETAFAAERSDLQRRITANADGRLEEFRNALASELRLVLSKVPDGGAPVSADLGGVLLTRLHEVMDALEAKGIRVRANREGRE